MSSLRIDGLTEEELILDRLNRFLKIHVGRPAGQDAVMELKRRGKVAYHLDGGVMVVYLPGARLHPPTSFGSGGGDVA